MREDSTAQNYQPFLLTSRIQIADNLEPLKNFLLWREEVTSDLYLVTQIDYPRTFSTSKNV